MSAHGNQPTILHTHGGEMVRSPNHNQDPALLRPWHTLMEGDDHTGRVKVPLHRHQISHHAQGDLLSAPVQGAGFSDFWWGRATQLGDAALKRAMPWLQVKKPFALNHGRERNSCDQEVSEKRWSRNNIHHLWRDVTFVMLFVSFKMRRCAPTKLPKNEDRRMGAEHLLLHSGSLGRSRAPEVLATQTFEQKNSDAQIFVKKWPNKYMPEI